MPRDAREAGYVLGVAVQVVLVVLILGMLVFLASRFRMRVDLTSEKYYTLTESTKRVLSGLDDRLHIEAYFSPDAQLTGQLADARRTLRNVLDEYVQNGRGRVSVQFLDPNTDNDLREKATRLGIKPQTMSSRGDRTLSYKELWQGMRLRYGGAKQKVLELVQPTMVPFQYEMQLTPAIKTLTVEEKPKIALVATASKSANPGGQADYRQISQFPDITDRFELTRYPLNNGELIPDDYETLLLVRPQNLDDRQKYVLDQFLMRGGQLVVFADTDEFSIGQQRMFNRTVVPIDLEGSDEKFLEQLESYGAKVGTKVLLDDSQKSREPFQRLVQTQMGALPQSVYYPYWFHAVDEDWAAHA
ncbi:MAG: GldG family protein, partial [Planctomycetes bacterium]|nr:GldG family protein [Planctomycetota bacterium]